jgi:WD40 repeat protein
MLWDLSDRTHVRRLAHLSTNTFRIAAVTLSADGRTLATASWDGSIQVWDLTNVNQLRDRPVERACAITGGFDRDEWARYVGDLPYEQTCP